MPGCLVFVEHAAGEPQKPSLGVLSKAASLFDDVAACLTGHGVRDLAADVGAYGARTVYVADSPELASRCRSRASTCSPGFWRRAGIDTVLFGASVLASDVAAGLAARAGGGLNWDLTELRLDGGRPRSASGRRSRTRSLVDCGWKTTPRIGLVRSGTFEAMPAGGGGSLRVVDVPVALEDFSTRATMVDRETGSERRARDRRGGRSSSRAGAGSGRPTTSRSSRVSPRRSAAPSRRPGRSWTPAGTRTRPRSARRARRSRRSSTSRAASPAPSSTRSGCRAPARSSRSTRTRTRRSSTTATSASSGTCSTSCRS